MESALDHKHAAGALRAWLADVRSALGPITLQHLGFSDAEVELLPWVLDAVRERLGLELALNGVGGELVLIETGFRQRVSPKVLQAFLEGRPLLTLSTLPDAEGDTIATRRGVDKACGQIVAQLRELAAGYDGAVAEVMAQDGVDIEFDSGFDSRLDGLERPAPDFDEDRRRMLMLLRMGLLDPSAPPLVLSHGANATMRFDFASGRVVLDREAQQRLRAGGELPMLAPGRRPQADAVQRELDLVVWDLGLASGGYRLLDAPADWWHSPLATPVQASVARYTRDPLHLEMARDLFSGPVTPSELRRQARVGVRDLRAFLQACLFLGLAYWVPPKAA